MKLNAEYEIRSLTPFTVNKPGVPDTVLVPSVLTSPDGHFGDTVERRGKPLRLTVWILVASIIGFLGFLIVLFRSRRSH